MTFGLFSAYFAGASRAGARYLCSSPWLRPLRGEAGNVEIRDRSAVLSL